MRNRTKGMLYALGSVRLAARPVCGHHVGRMSNRFIVFAIFAAAMLFSTIREWSNPVACPRLPVARSNAGVRGR
jgi:hypothetical protein